MDRYAVIGNPVSHSLSPAIHSHFARQLGESVEYTALLAPLDDFAGSARRFFDGGGRGANVTLPFKLDAFRFAPRASQRALLAGAANFLAVEEQGIRADNTDGIGLVADLRENLGVDLAGSRILILGAGGAARGVIAPLLEAGPLRVVIANRTMERARELAQRFAAEGRVEAVALDAIPKEEFDLVLNATSTSIHGETLALPAHVLRAGALAYDMAYGPGAAAFLARARAQGMRASDGLGMLVEQAAESFRLWRGKRPATAEILAELRSRSA
ncbi:MAG TPA: shikimate dehydrogenase [Usitatibacter sp.]